MQPLMRAFAVTENDENTGAIYFARHDIVAKKAGAAEFADGDIGQVSCRRVPWADGYCGRPIPARLMVAHGWHFECCGCGQRIDDDMLADNRLPESGVIGTQGSAVYCGSRCARRHFRREHRRKREAAAAIAHFKALVLRRFPDVTFVDAHDNPNWRHHAYVTCEQGRPGWRWEQVIVAFCFPGMKIAPATYRLDQRYGHLIGPPAPYYSCCNGDREAFDAYARMTKQRTSALAQKPGFCAVSVRSENP